MSWYAIDALEDARDATASLLLPVDLSRWARLALIALFVGSVGSGGGGANVSNSGGTAPVNGGGTVDGVPIDQLPAWATPENFVIAAIALLALGFVLFLVWTLIGSVMEFVFVDGVVSKDVHVRKPFRERFWLGMRLFAFRVGIILAVFLLIGLPGAALVLGGASLSPSIFLFAIPLVFLAILLFFVVALALQLTTDFVVPTMIAEDRNVLSSWRRVAPLFRAEVGEFGLYVLLRFVLGILASIAIGIATALVLLVVAIPFAIVAGVVVLGLAAAQVSAFSTVGLVLLGILGVLFVAAAIATAAFVQMPVVTYFRYYSLFVLGRADESLDLVSGFRSEDDSPSTEGAAPA
ncbi:hypothetical protein ACFQJC_11495 [Haloferax namakaokahaiae]|uniref:Membrane domain of glycerophosphoryl diester phosphodiesterase n=1 Tax=Haloferax namakaokahaiae TaxID=1748331 RepID=A0ABD5ZFX7_9EURY